MQIHGKNVIRFSGSITPISVSAQSIAEQTFTSFANDLRIGEAVQIISPFPLTTQTYPLYGRVTAHGTLVIGFINPTAGSLVPTSGIYTVIAFR